MRRDLADALESATGLLVHPAVPNTMSPPCIVLRPAEQWVASGDTYGEWRVALVLTVYVKRVDWPLVVESIEDALPDVLTGLGEDWGVESIGEPYIAEVGDTSTPAVDITVFAFTSDL